MSKKNNTTNESQSIILPNVKNIKNNFNIDKRYNTLEKIELIYIDIRLIKPNSYNHNSMDEHEFNLLKLSIQEDGFTQPILLQQDYIIVDGEHRWLACKELGFTEMPAIVHSMTQEQMRIATIRHNAAKGKDNVEKMSMIFREIEKLGALSHAKSSLLVGEAQVEHMFSIAPRLEDSCKLLDTLVKDKDKNDKTFIPRDAASNNSYLNDIADSINKLQNKKESVEIFTTNYGDNDKPKNDFDNRGDRGDRGEVNLERDITPVKKDKPKGYRVYCMFTGDDALMVERVLGDNVAEMILELCKDYLDRDSRESTDNNLDREIEDPNLLEEINMEV